MTFEIHQGNDAFQEENKRTDFIWGDFIDEAIVDDLVSLATSDRVSGFEGTAISSEGEVVVDKSIKESWDIRLPIEHLEVKAYLNALFKVVTKYTEQFPLSDCGNRDSWGVVIDPQYQAYPVGGGFKAWHTERAGSDRSTVYRHLVYMTYLNDVPDGGTEWFHQDLYVPAQKGLTVIWPSDWTHFHRGRPSPTTEKEIVTGWFEFL
tara:strand:+ start:126 stop:743 length:618 start_codon:yes stop_codon:yes gene_type:complete